MKIRLTGSTFGTSLERLLWYFWRKLSKTQHAHNQPYPVGVWEPNQWSLNCRATTYERETLVQVDFPRRHCRMARSASRPCRARVSSFKNIDVCHEKLRKRDFFSETLPVKYRNLNIFLIRKCCRCIFFNIKTYWSGTPKLRMISCVPHENIPYEKIPLFNLGAPGC